VAASRALSRREVLQRGAVLSLLPLAERVLASAPTALAAPSLTDATLQAFADTLIPGKRAARTDLGNEIHPKAIAGAHPEPGAVQADTLLLYHHPLIGFDLVAPAFLADLQTRSLLRGGQFLDLTFAKRVAVCTDGLAPGNPTAQVWELAAAVPFAAFLCTATQKNATIDTSSGLQVTGFPGTAPRGYADFSYRRALSPERTSTGSLP
jgi:enediyne biosynthesis protein E8